MPARAANCSRGRRASISSSAQGSSPSVVRVLLEVRERRLGGLLVALDRRRLAEAGHAVVLDLDEDDLGGVLRAAGDDERLGELERRDPGGQLHDQRLRAW